MAQYKQCYCCGKSKEINQFSKRSSSKDGLQGKCKACNKIDNHKFRTEINPEHHAEWQRNNLDKLYKIVKRYRKADKGGKIYYIKNSEGMYYIGMTQMHLSVRWTEHKIHYKQAKLGKRYPLPGLHESFDKLGINNHEIGIIMDFDDISREDLRGFEKAFIQSFKTEGVCLNKIG